MFDDILKGLNDSQKEVALTENGAVLVLAGAGSGKTKTLVARARVLMARGVNPNNICAMTFTNKAAKEMKERIGEGFFPFFGTFHSIAIQILRREYEAVGIDKDFRILDESDQLSLMKRAIKEANIDLGKTSPKAVLGKISRAKNDFILLPELVADLAPWQRNIGEAMMEYDKALTRSAGLDFDDILLKVVELFEAHADVLARWRERFQHVLVDEYQDTNTVQYKLVKLLYGGNLKDRSLCVVGDDWQSIYSWRGADFRNILRFEKDFPNAKVIKLQKNYRSTQKILDAADMVIKSSRERSSKTMNATRASGEDVKIIDLPNEKAEAWFVAKSLTRPLKNCAVLYRTNAQSLAFEQVFAELGIKYKVYGGQKFFDRKEVKDILAYMHLVVGGLNYPALARIINIPARGVGAVSLDKFANFAHEGFSDYVRAMLAVDESDLSAKLKTTLQNLGDKLLEVRSGMHQEISPAEILRKLIENVGYWDYLDDGTDPEGSRRANLEALVTEAGAFPTINDFLATATLASSVDEDMAEDAVVLSTIHASKGLEFDRVFVVGLEEGLLPFSRAVDNDEELEEEIRLTYVAMSRAKNDLFLLWARQRCVFGQRKYQERSRFLNLLDKKQPKIDVDFSELSCEPFGDDEGDGELRYEKFDDGW